MVILRLQTSQRGKRVQKQREIESIQLIKLRSGSGGRGRALKVLRIPKRGYLPGDYKRAKDQTFPVLEE